MPNYHVEVTYKVRQVRTVEADSPELAEKFVDMIIEKHLSVNNVEIDTFISAYTSTVKELSKQ